MGQVLYGSTRPTEATRRAIQRSEESVRALARRHGVSPTTVQKWRKRASATDAPMRPKVIHSTVLSTEEEAVIVAFRRHTPTERPHALPRSLIKGKSSVRPLVTSSRRCAVSKTVVNSIRRVPTAITAVSCPCHTITFDVSPPCGGSILE